MNVTNDIGLIALDGLPLLIDLQASAHRAVERALRALVGLFVIEMLVAHCSALATDHPSFEHAPQRVCPDYSTVYFRVGGQRQNLRRVHAGRSRDVV